MAQSVATSNRGPGIRDTLLSGVKTAMSAFLRFFASLRDELKDRVDSRITPGIDIESIACELKVETRGRADGEVEQPSHGEESASGMQREIIAYFRNRQHKAQRKAATVAEKLRENGLSIDLLGTIADISDIPARCESSIMRLSAKVRPDIERARLEAARINQECGDGENSGGAVLVTENSSTLGYSLLTLLLVFGSAFIVNNLAVSTIEYVPSTWAIVVMALGVIAPFVITREVLRSANLGSKLHRGMATTGIGASVVFVVVLAVFVAAFISASVAGGNPGVQEVLNAFAAPTTGLAIVAEGWVGAAMVIVAGMLAVGMAHRSVETRVQSQPVSREPANETSPIRKLSVRLSNRCNRIIDRADKELAARSGRAKKRVREYARMVDGAKNIPAALAAYDVALEDACNIVLDRYRAANREARKSEDPASFNAYICLGPDDNSYAAHFDQAEELGNEFQQTLQKLDSEVAKARQKLRNLNSRSLASIEDGWVSDSDTAYDRGDLI